MFEISMRMYKQALYEKVVVFYVDLLALNKYNYF